MQSVGVCIAIDVTFVLLARATTPSGGPSEAVESSGLACEFPSSGVQAMQITAIVASERIGRAGVKNETTVFLDRVYIKIEHRIAITTVAQDAVYVDPTGSRALAWCNDTFPRTQLALNLLIHKTPSQYYAVIITKLGRR